MGALGVGASLKVFPTGLLTAGAFAKGAQLNPLVEQGRLELRRGE